MDNLLTTIVLTLNEEVNMPQCLDSLRDWSTDIVVLDSGSTDRTKEIVSQAGVPFFYRKFDNYAAQRIYAIEQLSIKTDWVLFLDADEAMTIELKREIDSLLLNREAMDGYFIRLKFMFMNRWIRHGAYRDVMKLVLFQRSKLQSIERDMDELVVMKGKTGQLTNYILHNDQKSVQFWYEKHVRYSRFQAQELLINNKSKTLTFSKIKDNRDRKRWIKERVWGRIPVLMHPFIYFFYVYIIKLGFLDGSVGFIYHFSHAFLYRFMTAVLYLEERRKKATNSTN